jgi:cell division protein FtsQ
MRPNWSILKLTLLMLGITVAYGFSEIRNQKRPIVGLKVQFVGDENYYITQDAVNKLLIQNIGALPKVDKEKIVLNTVESAVQAHDMVKNAQIFMSLDGQLNAKITQRIPIGRISADYPYYLDDEGKKMPLSPNYAARVPLISGHITERSLHGAYLILQKVNQDNFLKTNLIGIRIAGEDDFSLLLRSREFIVKIGSATALTGKFANFKAFYAKALQENSLNHYRSVNLEFSGQVVCTKI